MTKTLEDRYFELEKEVKELSDKYKQLEEKIDKDASISSLSEGENVNFYRTEEWLKEMREKYKDEIIVYTKKNGTPILLAHSNDREALLDEIDELFDDKKISSKDLIFFR